MKKVVCLVLLFSMIINCLPINPAKPVNGVSSRNSVNVAAESAIKLDLGSYEQDWKLENVTTIVIASPKAPFTMHDIDTITQFVTNGGNLMINGRYGSANVLNPLLLKFGLQISSTNILSSNTPYDIGSFTTDRINRTNPITRDIKTVFMNWPEAITVNNKNALKLIQSDEYTSLDINGNNQIDPNEPRGPFPLLVTLNYGKGKVAVFSGTMHETIFDGYESWVRNLLNWFDSEKQTKSILFDETKNEQTSINLTRANEINQLHPEFFYYGKFRDLAISMGYNLITQPKLNLEDHSGVIILTNNYYIITLNVFNKDIKVVNITNKLSNINYIIHSKESIFSVFMVDHSNQVFPLLTNDFTNMEILVENVTNGKKLVINWKDNVNYKIQVNAEITVMIDNPLSEWSISIDNGEDLAVFQVYYPVIDGLHDLGTTSENLYGLFPHVWGDAYLVKDPYNVFSHSGKTNATEWWGDYPKDQCAQFMSFFDSQIGGGIQVSANDTQGYFKHFNSKISSDGLGLEIRVENIPTLQFKTNYTLPYSLEIGVFYGNTWYDAAATYKSWTQKQWWSENTSERLHTTDKNEVIGLVKLGLHSTFNFPAVKYQDAMGVGKALQDQLFLLQQLNNSKISVMIAGWEINGHIRTYPDVFPPNEGEPAFTQLVDTLHKSKDETSAFYIASWVDETSPLVKSSGNSFEVKDLWGNVAYIYWGAFTVRYLAADVASPTWQKTIIDNSVRLVRDYGIDALYFDTAPGVFLNYNPEAGHPIGGGNYGFLAWKNIVEEIRRQTNDIRPDLKIYFEGLNELYLPYIDGFLNGFYSYELNYTPQLPIGESVPLTLFLFHNNTLSLSTFLEMRAQPALGGGDVVFNDRYWFTCIARAGVYGIVPGIGGINSGFTTSFIQNSTQRDKLTFFEDFAYARATYARDFLVNGEMIKPLKVDSPTFSLTSNDWWPFKGLDGLGEIKLNAVESCTWKSPTGDIGVVLANSWNRPVNTTIHLGQDQNKFDNNSLVYTIYDNELLWVKNYSDVGNELHLTLDPKKVTLVGMVNNSEANIERIKIQGASIIIQKVEAEISINVKLNKTLGLRDCNNTLKDAKIKFDLKQFDDSIAAAKMALKQAENCVAIGLLASKPIRITIETNSDLASILLLNSKILKIDEPPIFTQGNGNAYVSEFPVSTGIQPINQKQLERYGPQIIYDPSTFDPQKPIQKFQTTITLALNPNNPTIFFDIAKGWDRSTVLKITMIDEETGQLILNQSISESIWSTHPLQIPFDKVREPVSDLVVTVKDAEGNPISGATISSIQQPSEQSVLTGISGSSGSITFTDIAAGSYTLQASMSGYVNNFSSVTITTGNVTASSITLQILSTGGILGYVYEEIMVGVILSVVVLIWLRRRQ
jgi:hypothetical protein